MAAIDKIEDLQARKQALEISIKQNEGTPEVHSLRADYRDIVTRIETLLNAGKPDDKSPEV